MERARSARRAWKGCACQGAGAVSTCGSDPAEHVPEMHIGSRVGRGPIVAFLICASQMC